MVTRIILVLLVLTGVASAQAPQITIGIYAPSVSFETAGARLAYVQGLAKAIEQNTSIPTKAEAYASMAALKKANPDYAIVEAQCYATNAGWQLLANAKIDGGTTRPWALYSSAGDNMQALKGKKLAYMATGCNDDGFINNAMLETEVDKGFWGSWAAETGGITAAVAAVSSYKTAQAVFAPASAAKGLTKVFDTGSVANPAFVEVNGKMPAETTNKVAAAVVGYGGSGAIQGWTRGARDVYQGLAGRMQPVRKTGVFAPAEAARLDAKDVLIDPPTLREAQFVAVRHHFVRAPNARLE